MCTPFMPGGMRRAAWASAARRLGWEAVRAEMERRHVRDMVIFLPPGAWSLLLGNRQKQLEVVAVKIRGSNNDFKNGDCTCAIGGVGRTVVMMFAVVCR